MAHFAEIVIDDAELDAIMDRLDKAKEEIYDCYSELKRMGIVKITTKGDPVNVEH